MSIGLTGVDVLFLQRSCSSCGLYRGPLDGKWSLDLDGAEASLAKEGERLRAELGLFDPRSEKNIATLMPPVQALARRFLRAAADFSSTVRILSGTRTYAEQDALYAIGRTIELRRKPVTNARGGKSNHNFGIAWDVGIFAADGRYMDGKTRADEAAYAALGKFIKARVEGIEWGGDWKTFVDMPHYQLATGKTASQIQKIFEAGKPLQA